MEAALLEVVALHPADAKAAEAGGADRLCVGSQRPDGAYSAEPGVVGAIASSTSLPVRAVLRLSEGFATTGGELTRLSGLGADYLAEGAEGVVFGFLTATLEIDVPVCAAIADAVGGAPWTFSRALDHALDTNRAWRQVRTLPGVDGVLTAGSALGMATGQSELADRARSDGEVARLAVAAGGLAAEHVPWLLHAGVRAFQVGASVRPGRSWSRSSVDAAYVRSWRSLLDDAIARQRG